MASRLERKTVPSSSKRKTLPKATGAKYRKQQSPLSIQTSPLDDAIVSLMNNQKEEKTSSGLKYVYDPVILKLVRGLFKSDRIYRFQGTRSSTLTANGSGILAASIGLSVANVLEVTPLQALFDEIRVTHCQLHVQGYQYGASAALIPGIDVIAFNPSAVEGTNPASYTQVARLPSSRLINSASQHKGYVLDGRVPARPFADITADALISELTTPVIPTGSYGTWWFYTVTGNIHGASAVVYTFILKIGYELRARS